jgi:putative sigma-54 modulation protein
MKTEIKSNIEVTQAIKDYVEEKVFSKLEKFSDYVTDVVIRLNIQNENTHEATVLIQLKGQGRYNKVSAKTADLYTSISNVSEKAVRKARQFKEKTENYKAKQGEIHSPIDFPVTHHFENEEYDVAKIKRFNIKPMFVEEAIMQMNSLGHAFFFYFDASTETPCVVYKRHDGAYGILESDL